ncbi:uncharacterized protein LOC105167668 isoform X3 [Sesamum indicum]|uniref:Uncharacterized protein LOC105167668 isoform X3 n=1 Tax=Sesamum indicum TaxID=4182 RepID=A0A8M8V5G8_SESIN|nr:uncharacterized protein LOC105167668 isoform X3 [Sesamum indicum]
MMSRRRESGGGRRDCLRFKGFTILASKCLPIVALTLFHHPTKSKCLPLFWANEVNALETLCRSRPSNIEGYSQLVDRFEHRLHIIKEAITQQPQQIASPSDDAPTTSYRQSRSCSRMSTGSVERHDIGVDIAGPSTVYPPQPPQDYYMPQPSQDEWFQSTPYMPNQTQDYSFDLGFGINQTYAQGYNISPIPFP